LKEGLQSRRERRTGKQAAGGLTYADARRAARRDFGSSALAADQCRDARGISWLETLWRDIRYAIRGFRRTPTFALTVVGTIAVGLGLNTAVFTIFNAYVLRPFAVRDPWSLYEVAGQTRSGPRSLFTWRESER